MKSPVLPASSRSLVWCILLLVGLAASQIFPSLSPSPCWPVCENGGTCDTNTGTCICGEHWTGQSCTERLCPRCEHGEHCGSDTNFICQCNASWTGETCATAVCDPECKNDGICTKPNLCSCNSNEWGGKICDRPLCDEGFCKNGGSCHYPNINCSCPPQWKGSRCEVRTTLIETRVLVLSIFLAVVGASFVILIIFIIIGKLKKKRYTLFEDNIEIEANTAYKVVKKKGKSGPLCDTDVIYDQPLASYKERDDSKKESIYENTDYYI